MVHLPEKGCQGVGTLPMNNQIVDKSYLILRERVADEVIQEIIALNGEPMIIDSSWWEVLFMHKWLEKVRLN